MAKCKELLKKYLPLIAFLAAAAWLFYQIYPIIFATHDDMRSYMLVRRGKVWEFAVSESHKGRISQLWNQVILAIPFLGGRVWFYKGIAFAGFLFDIWAMRLFLKTHIDRDFADLSAVLVTAFACISNYHNLLISYALDLQLPIAFLFLSLYAYGNWLNTKRTADCALSCLFLLLACMLYEAFYAALLLYALWSLTLPHTDETNYWTYLRHAAKRIVPQIFVLAIYLIVYFSWRQVYPTLYDGTSFTLRQPFMSLLTAGVYGISFFPLTELMRLSETNDLTFGKFLSQLSPAAWGTAILTAVVFAFLLPRIRMERRTLTLLSVFSFAGIFVPCLIIAFSEKYPDWVRRDAIGYVPAYYSFLFLVIFLAALALRIYHAMPQAHHRTTALIVMTVGVLFCTLCASAVNALWKPHFAQLSLRYRNFDHAVSAPITVQCDETWQFYAPDNPGIHLNTAFMDEYLKIYNQSDVRYITDTAKLDPEKNTLCMRMPADYAFAVLGETDAEMHAVQLTYCAVQPEACPVTLMLTDGSAFTVYASDGDILSAPEGTAFDLAVRVQHSDREEAAAA